MAELKTQRNAQSVAAFLEKVLDEQRRVDSFALLKMMKEITGREAEMWGDSIVGFGHVHYKYESGREGDWFAVGFSPRKQNLTLYMMMGFSRFEELLGKLGKHKTGKSCLYIQKLSDINQDVLREMITLSSAELDSPVP